MTELMEIYKEKGIDALREKISGYETERLLEELDDTIQFDILKVSTEEWVARMIKEKKVYVCIINELKRRI